MLRRLPRNPGLLSSALLSSAVSMALGCGVAAPETALSPETAPAFPVKLAPAGTTPHPPIALLPGPLGTDSIGFAAPDDVAPAPPAPTSRCNEQTPQPFLVRGNYVSRPDASRPEAEARRRMHDASIAYRTREYGYADGFGDASVNPIPPKDYAIEGSFFGLRVKMNNRVLTALGCVEEVIQRDCGDGYRPEVLDGLRGKNTFHNNEVSNHLYGIAIDIDFHKNSCCGCVAPLSEWGRCKIPGTAYDRAALPKCWIESFERFGFYWLGHDVLEDTMHFEFLGDPDRIVKADQ